VTRLFSPSSTTHLRSWLLAIVALAAGPAGATTYELEDGQPAVFGAVEYYTAAYEDTLTDIARRYSLGYEEIVRVNPGVDPWLPGAGTQIVIPGRRILPSGPREGIIVNLPEHRLYYFPKRKKNEPQTVITYPVSIAKMDWHTPLGETRVIAKEKNPSWYPPESVRKEHAARGEPLPAVVKPGPDNPLGAYKIRLAITPGAYLIHGTNNPLAVGMAVTHGCMRMYPEDIEALFPLVPIGTKVRIVNEPVKVAFVDREVIVEAHPPVDGEGQTTEPNLELFSALLDQSLGETPAGVHWDFAQEILAAANGLPTVVGLQADLDDPDVPGEALPEGMPPAAPIADATGAPAAADAPATESAASQGEASSSGATSPEHPPVVTMLPPASPAELPALAEAPVAAAPAATAPPAPTTLPAPYVPPGNAPAASSTGARTFPAEELPAATSAPSHGSEAGAGTAVATGEHQP